MLSTLKHGQGRVLVEKKRVQLTETIQMPTAVTLIMEPEKPDQNVPESDGPLTILYEDSNWLVVDKPAGLTSVPGPSNRTDTLVNRVKGQLKRQGSKDLVPHVLTRLDRFTSGLVLVGKHRFAQGLLNKQLETKQVQKTYFALVGGSLEKDHDLIDQPLQRAQGSFAQEVAVTGKKAVTEYWVTRRFGPQATLTKVKLHTGRTHQIRAHFAYLGHPLLGDELYGGALNYGIKRQALHAAKLSFIDPFTGQKLTFTSPIPADLQAVLADFEHSAKDQHSASKN
ncbi:ribosomal large subunit pseudouridine synthase D [Ligilactobacillus salitolerans]|uniref:Pseudouridine synthase n=2 Tax=Ligilactobacillus salitolerans TaxID=1808352 RepID=A0A401IRU5_9LACO|nr:ribosomal large subunit pseudouridine synthase D [Ligilactobacillus salitolerans]